MQVPRAAQALPSQDADVLVSGPDGPSDVDPREFLHADFSDCDDVPELSVGSLGDVGWGSAQDRHGSGSSSLRSGSERGRRGHLMASSYSAPLLPAGQRRSRSISQQAPLVSLQASSPAPFSSALTFAAALHSPGGSASGLSDTSFARM